MISKTSETYRQIKKHYDLVLTDKMLVIDPSMGSQSSLPGYAIYDAGQAVTAGTLDVPRTGDHPVRLSKVVKAMTKIITLYEPKVFVIENIPVAPGSFNMVSLASLHMARGALLSCIGDKPYISIYPQSWKKHVRSTYIKGDMEDAVEMGYIIIKFAEAIKQEVKDRGKTNGKNKT